jgi:ATP-dependent DNA helicase RecG
LLGYALGDGSFQGSQIRLHVQELDYGELITNLGDVTIGKVYTDVRYNESNPVKSFGVLKQNKALRELALDGVSCKDKFVPVMYKFGSINQRIALLQGLLDSDGTIDKGGRRVRFSNTSKQLAEDVAELVRSLGRTRTT